MRFMVRQALFPLSVLLINALLLVAYSGGPPPGYTGAPGDSDCTICHGTYLLNSGSAQPAILAPDFVGNAASIPVTVAISNTQNPVKNGFQMCVQSSLGSALHGLQPAASNPLAVQVNPASFAYVNHTSTGNTLASWDVDWHVPAALPPGPSTIYAAVNDANGDYWSTGDYIYTISKPIYRSGLLSTGSTWSVGATHPLIMDMPPLGQPGHFIMAASLDPTPTSLGGPFLFPVNPFDPFVSLALSLPSVFQNFTGPLDAQGVPLVQPQVVVPPLPSLAGIQLHFAYVTLDAAFSAILDVSSRLSVTLVP